MKCNYCEHTSVNIVVYMTGISNQPVHLILIKFSQEEVLFNSNFFPLAVAYKLTPLET